MTNNQYRIEFTSDLSRGITVTPIRFALLSNENMAHAFVIKTTRNGQKNDLTGSNVRAYFIPASQNLSVLIDGEVDKNGNAVVELTKACYYYTGHFFLIIETETDNVTSCIFYGDGYVTKTNTDEIVAPPETVGIISAVLYNKPQSLTDAQKAQARANIGAISEVDVPQKGVDYWTPADQEAIVQQVIAALGTPVFGTIDENKHITLSGHLVNGTYTLSFEDTDGFTSEVCTINKSSSPNYTNVISLSTDVNGNPYNGGLGYREGYRYSSSSGGDVAGSGLCVTGYIECKDTDTLYFKNVGMNRTAGVSNGCNMYTFNSLSGISSASADAATMTNYQSAQWDSNNDIVSVKVNNDPSGATVWVRCNTTYLGADSIITINEPIE